MKNWSRQISKILLKLKEDIFDDAAHNIKKAQKRQKKNYVIRHLVNKTKLEIGDMVVKENRVNVTQKGGKFDPMRDSKYYMIKEFLSNGSMILRDLHINMVDPVPIPQGHLKKILKEDKAEIEDEQKEQRVN